VDRDGGGAPVKSERGEVSNAAYPKLCCSKGVVDEVCELVLEQNSTLNTSLVFKNKSFWFAKSVFQLTKHTSVAI
jgi:hypothetical protein